MRPPDVPLPKAKCGSVLSRLELSLVCSSVLIRFMALSFAQIRSRTSPLSLLTDGAYGRSRYQMTLSRFAALIERCHPGQIDFKGYRPLQQGHGKNNAMISFEADQNPFEP